MEKNNKMVNDPIKEATSYIEDSVSGFQDVSEISWRFLLGNRILEYLDEMEEAVEKGTDFQVIAANLDSYRIKLGNVTFDIKACKSNSGNSSISQPNLLRTCTISNVYGGITPPIYTYLWNLGIGVRLTS